MVDAARKEKYQKMLKDSRHEIEFIDAQIQRELDEVKARITALQSEKEAHLTIYGSYCQLLGIENDMDVLDEDDE